MALHERLRAARLAANHDVASAFARLIGVEPNTVYRLESGRLQPSIETLAAWATVCGVSADSLLGLGTEDTVVTNPVSASPADEAAE